MEESELVAEILGEQVFTSFLRNKRDEWEAYRQNVSPFELQTLPGDPLGAEGAGLTDLHDGS